MTDEQRQYIIAMQQQGMRPMSPEQMAERARQQAAGMQNAAQSYPHDADSLRNLWPHYDPEPYTYRPTRMERLRAWLSRFWGK